MRVITGAGDAVRVVDRFGPRAKLPRTRLGLMSSTSSITSSPSQKQHHGLKCRAELASGPGVLGCMIECSPLEAQADHEGIRRPDTVTVARPVRRSHHQLSASGEYIPCKASSKGVRLMSSIYESFVLGHPRASHQYVLCGMQGIRELIR
jgi:hypothetical protein